jgi:hypothetical protein
MQEPTADAPTLDVADDPDAKLTAALAAAQAAFPSIAKTKTAQVRSDKGNYSYGYADLADVLAAVRPVLAAHGLALVQQTQTGRVDNGVLLTTTLRHVGGGRVDSEVVIGQSSSNPQQFGGALTYLRRYEVVTLLGIAAEEDMDAQNVKPLPERQVAPVASPAWALPANANGEAAARAGLAKHIGETAAQEFLEVIRRYVEQDHLPVVVTRTVLGITKRLDDAMALEERAENGETLSKALTAAGADTALFDEKPTESRPAGPYTDVEEPQALAVAKPSKDVLRDRGCTCQHPGEGPVDNDCPLHGDIPF